jgi:carbon dioxide concentrating mechanism protein CcmN
MNAPSLQPLNELCFYISGNVIIHPDACIAADVFLQADPNSQLVIGARVVIGPRSILHVSSGSLTIGSDVTVGSQVLMAGAGTIGDGACIGSFSTLIGPINIIDQAVIPPRSLIGDNSRRVDLEDESSDKPFHRTETTTHSTSVKHSVTSTSSDSAPQSETDSASHTIKKTVVYGRTSVEKLINVMFPSKNMTMSNPGNTDSVEQSDNS